MIERTYDRTHRFGEGVSMREDAFTGPLRILSYVIVLLMAIAVVYAGYITVSYWSGIGV
jgi:hypothetical protein